MNAKKALGIVVAWAGAFALIGAALGAFLGVAAPDYYRVMLRPGATAEPISSRSRFLGRSFIAAWKGSPNDRFRRRIEVRSANFVGRNTMAAILDALLVMTPGTCGGRIRIDGSRITVHRVATLYKQGQSAEDISLTYPHLTLGQIYTALAYYHVHREEVDRELAHDDAEYDRLKSEAECDRLKASGA